MPEVENRRSKVDPAPAPDGMDTVFQFDTANRLVTVTRGPAANPVVLSTFSYYDNDLLEQATNGNGSVTDYTYDNAGQVKQILHTDGGSSPVTLTKLDYNYTDRGEIERIDETVGAQAVYATVFQYDAQGRLTWETRCDVAASLSGQCNVQVYDIEYEYDPGGNRTQKNQPCSGAGYVLYL